MRQQRNNRDSERAWLGLGVRPGCGGCADAVPTSIVPRGVHMSGPRRGRGESRDALHRPHPLGKQHRTGRLGSKLRRQLTKKHDFEVRDLGLVIEVCIGQRYSREKESQGSVRAVGAGLDGRRAQRFDKASCQGVRCRSWAVVRAASRRPGIADLCAGT